MNGDLPPQMRPMPAFAGRSMMEVFAGSAAGNADDHLRMCEISLLAGDAGTLPLDLALGMGEMFAKMAIVRGRIDAREHVINILLAQARRLVDKPSPSYRETLAEAVSYLDELAGEDNELAAGNLDQLLANYVSAGGRECDRGAIVSRAKELRWWRDKYGAFA